MFDSKLFTLAMMRTTNGNMGKLISEKVITGHYKEEIKWTHPPGNLILK